MLDLKEHLLVLYVLVAILAVHIGILYWKVWKLQIKTKSDPWVHLTTIWKTIKKLEKQIADNHFWVTRELAGKPYPGKIYNVDHLRDTKTS